MEEENEEFRETNVQERPVRAVPRNPIVEEEEGEGEETDSNGRDRLVEKLLAIRLFRNKIRIKIMDKSINFLYSGTSNSMDNFAPLSFISQSLDLESLEMYINTPRGTLIENTFCHVTKNDNEALSNTDEILYLGNVIVGEHEITGKKIYVEHIVRNQRFCAIRFKLMGREYLSGNSHLGLRHIPPIQYFEVHILQSSERALGSCYSIGLCMDEYCEDIRIALCGWYDSSVGYHSDNGGVYDDETSIDELEDLENEPFEQGDIVGCGWNRSDGTVFFTKNGVLQDRKSCRDPKKFDMFGAVMFQNTDENRPAVISLNRGRDTINNPFLFREMNVKVSLFEKMKKARRFCDVVVLTTI